MSVDAAYLQQHALDAKASGAYVEVLQGVADAGTALDAAAALQASDLQAHESDVEARLEEAYFSGKCVDVVAFLYEAQPSNTLSRETALDRAFRDRRGLERMLADIGVPCLSLLEGDGGLASNASALDIERHIASSLPPKLRELRHRAVIMFGAARVPGRGRRHAQQHREIPSHGVPRL